MQIGTLLEYAELAASPRGATVWEIEHVGQEWDGVDCGLSWSNGSELDHCLGSLHRIAVTPRACPWASDVP